MRCSGLPGPRPRAAQLPPQHIRGQPDLARRNQVGGADKGQTFEDILATPFISTPGPLTPVYPPVCDPLPRSLVMCGGADWGGPVADCFSWSAR